MLEYLTSKHKGDPPAGAKKLVDDEPVLDDDNTSFLESLTSWSDADTAAHEKVARDNDPSDDVAARPPLPPRLKTPDLTWDSDSESFVREEVVNRQAKSRGLAPSEEKPSSSKKKGSSSSGGGIARRFSSFLSSATGGSVKHGHHEKEAGTVARVTDDTPLHAPVPSRGQDPGSHQHAAHLAVPGQVDADSGVANISSEEEQRENADLNRVLDDLNLAMKGGSSSGKKGGSKSNKIAVAMSAESAELVRKFVLVLKDLVNGVPTAADDLRHLLDDRDGTLQKGFDKLPKSLRKLVAQMPTKLTASLGPEILAAAAETQGIKVDAAEATSTKSAAKAALLPLITKPTALVKMLKAIMNALKLRWPAFAGTSAIWSVGLFLLMFVLWYCHKRGREVRLEKEAKTAAAEAAANAPEERGGRGHGGQQTDLPVRGDGGVDSLPRGQLPPPPVGAHATKR